MSYSLASKEKRYKFAASLRAKSQLLAFEK
jgi:hypothetical protein